MRRVAKVDDNHAEIVRALRDIGCSVLSLAAVGKGSPDLLVGASIGVSGRRVNFLLEIKDGAKPPSARKLTADEAQFHASWRGHLAIVESVDDALRVVMAR